MQLMQALEIGGDGDAGNKSGVHAGQLIHHCGLQFARSAPEIALEYYMLAAQALGNDRQTKAKLLRELLTESNAFGFLLGSGGSHKGEIQPSVSFSSDLKAISIFNLPEFMIALL